MTKQELKANLTAFLDAKAAACEAVDDDTASGFCVALFPKMKYDGGLIKYQSRIQYDGKLYRAVVDIWDEEQYNPTNAPNLWREIIYSGGIREIPEVITAAEAFAAGEKGKWKGEIYESLISGNVWTPEQYAGAWQKL
jgi:hypothetical protein